MRPGHSLKSGLASLTRRTPTAWNAARSAGRRLLSAAAFRLRVGGRRFAALPLRLRLALIAAALMVGLLAGASALLLAPVRIPDEPRSASVAQTSRIYAADGSVLATLHGGINREPVALEDLPRHVWEAAVASEDARFFEHSGVDLRAIARAVRADVAAGAPVQGGSTITQQYAKSAYLGRERTLWRKLREARIAYQLERRLSKEEILERYLNTVYFGRGAYGIDAAAKAYFGKPARELTVSESAMLVGLIPAPGRVGPDDDPGATERRRRAVVGRMETVGFVDAADAEQALGDQPTVAPLDQETPVRFGWFVDAVQRYLFARYGVDKVLTGGLQVRTTLDPDVQQAAEAAVASALPDRADPYAAIASVDPQTGYVRALVGGRQWGPERFNIAIQGRRQPGSAFKPFVLIAALESGISPEATYRGPRSVCLDEWRPSCRVSNFDRRGFGRITVENATVHSVNTVYAQLILDVKPSRVVEVAKRMGIPGPAWAVPKKTGCRPEAGKACARTLRPLPSLALGAQEVTPLEMASAYATLAAGGVYRRPTLVEEVVDGSGDVLERGPAPAKRAISGDVAAEATHILEEVISRGTGRRADIGSAAAGKTGTTSDHRDAWFTGYTSDLATAVWVGHRDTNQQLVDVHGVRRVTGGTIPAEIWADFMTTTDLSVSEVEPAASGLAGRELRYRLRVSNSGPWSARRVVLRDELPSATKFVSATSTAGRCSGSRRVVTCRIGGLGKGARAEVDVVVRPKKAGTFTHTATASAKRPDANAGNDALSRQMVVEPASDLSVRATGPRSPVTVGELVTYRLTARNRGPSDASGVVLSALVPPGSELVAAETAGGSCGREGDQVVCRVGELAAGRKVRANVVIIPAAAGTARSTVRAAATEADPRADDNVAEGEAVVEPSTDLGLRIEGVPEKLLANQELRYRLLVSNAGPSPASGVELSGRTPSRIDVVSMSPAQGACTKGPGGFSCALGELPQGTSTAVEVVATSTGTGPVRLSARVEGKEDDADRDNDDESVRTEIMPVADVGVSLEGPDAVPVGEEIAYRLFVWSHGPSRARHVKVTLPSPGACSSNRLPVKAIAGRRTA